MSSDHPSIWAELVAGKLQWSGLEKYVRTVGYAGGEAGWDVEQDGVSFFTDRYGICPIYYSHSKDFFGCSTSLQTLARNLPQLTLNAHALSSFFQIGFFCNEETPFNEIRVLFSGVRASWKNGDLHLGETPLVPNRLEVTYEQAMDGYIDLFRQSIQKQLADYGRPDAMLLSGGRDSRHILLELHAQNVAPEVAATVQRPLKDSSDPDVAKELTSRIGIRHEILQQDPLAYDSLFQTMLITNFETDEQDWYRSAFRWLGKHTQTSMDGLAGDRVSGQFHYEGFKPSLIMNDDLDESVDALVKRWGAPQERAVIACSNLGIEFDRDAVYAIVHEALKKCIYFQNAYMQFYLNTRTRREIARGPIDMGQNKFSFPYLDPDLVDFLSSVPPEITRQFEFHADVIKRAYPEFADIPYANALFRNQKSGRVAQSIRMRAGRFLKTKKPQGLLVRKPVWWQFAYVDALKSVIAKQRQNAQTTC